TEATAISVKAGVRSQDRRARRASERIPSMGLLLGQENRKMRAAAPRVGRTRECTDLAVDHEIRSFGSGTALPGSGTGSQRRKRVRSGGGTTGQASSGRAKSRRRMRATKS